LTPDPFRPALLGASGHLHYRPADHRPAFTRLDSSADASLEVWLFCPFSVCQPRCAFRIAVPGRSRFGVFEPSAPTPLADFALAVFPASRLDSFVTLLRRRPRGSFVSGFFHPRTGHAGLLSRPGRDFRPGDARGIHIPFAVLLRPAGEIIFRRLEPTCRFASRPPRVSSSRSTPLKACRWAFGRGFWVTVRGSAVPCFSPAPPWLVCTGSLELTSQDCPGFYFLSQVFDAGRRSPPLEPFRPWASDPNRAALLQRDIAMFERALRRFK